MKNILKSGSFYIGVGVTIIVVSSIILALLGVSLEEYSGYYLVVGLSLMFFGAVKIGKF